MLDRREFFGTAAIASAALAAVGTAVEAQTRPPALFGAARLNGFGPEADRLARRTGLWDVIETVWDHPGAEAVVSKGLVAERFMFGSMLQEIIRPPEDLQRRAVARTDMLNYNRMDNRWSYVSLDTRVPIGLMPAWSDDPGKADEIEMTFVPFAVPGPGGATPGQFLRMRQIIRYLRDDEDVKDQFFTLADGNGAGWHAHRYAYRRRAA